MKKTIILMGILFGLGMNAQWSLTGNSGTTPGTNFIGTTDNKDLVFKTNSTENMRIYSNGNIDFALPTSNSNYRFFGNLLLNTAESSSAFKIYSTTQEATLFRVDSDYMNVYLQEDGGNVIVGGKNILRDCTTCNGYRLFVKDGIKTEKVKVEIAAENGWADYVFKKDYKLMPLKEVESYITTNGHLPEVPSTEEAIKNGIELKEMNILLLKKIEELTLHAIEQNKRIEKLEANRNK